MDKDREDVIRLEHKDLASTPLAKNLGCSFPSGGVNAEVKAPEMDKSLELPELHIRKARFTELPEFRRLESSRHGFISTYGVELEELNNRLEIEEYWNRNPWRSERVTSTLMK